MPITPTYPGVYVEEIPSGVRTIVGVATSITAFLGRTKHGYVNKPTTIFDYGSFERLFGRLDAEYPMSYAVRDFFLNGGGQAVIVRLYMGEPPAAGAAAAAIAPADMVTSATALFDAARTEAAKDGATTDVVLAVVRGLAATQVLDPTVQVSKARQALDDAEDALEPQALAVTQAQAELRVAETMAQSLRQLTLTSDEASLQDALKDALTQANTALTAKAGDVSTKNQAQSTSIKDVQDKRAALAAAIQKVAILQSIANKVQEIVKDMKPAADGKLDISKLLTAEPDIKKFVDGIMQAQPAALTTEPDIVSESGPLDYTAYLRGIRALLRVDLFNLLCIPPDTRPERPADYRLRNQVYQEALTLCQQRRALLVVDPPPDWQAIDDLVSDAKGMFDGLNLSTPAARNAAIFYPRVYQADPLNKGQIDTFAPCGLVAGVMARTDRERGVWKAPAGIDAAINGIVGLEVNLTDDENGVLNQIGINCLRSFPIYGRVVWGARTMRGSNAIGDEYKYIPVRRTALFIEESLFRGLKWVVFEPNDEPLWAQIRLNVGAFMHNLFRQGAFQGSTPRDAYFVKCDKETTTQNDINQGIVNIVVGFAPLKPAEFVFIKLQQITGQIEV